MGKAARSGMPRPKATLGSLLRAAVLSEPVAVSFCSTCAA